MEKVRELSGGTKRLDGTKETKVDDVPTLLKDCYAELKNLRDGTGDYTPSHNAPSRIVGTKVEELVARLKKMINEIG